MSILDSTLTPLAKLKNLEDIQESRDNALRKYAIILTIFEEIEQELESIANYSFPYDCKPKSDIKEFTRKIDRRLWQTAFDLTGFSKYMDEQARNEFSSSLEFEPPAFTVENIKSIFLSAAQDSEKMFNRGVAKIFRHLSDDHRTNEDQYFSIGKKFIAEWMFTFSWNCDLVCRREATWNDLDRVVKICAGKEFHSRELETKLNAHLKENGPGSVYEDDFYRIKGYKKGTAHIELKKQETIDAINECIAKHYGVNIADGRQRRSKAA